ncbi:unnamed protein product [Calypogeia fissa]
MRLGQMLSAAGMEHSDGDLSAVVRAGTSGCTVSGLIMSTAGSCTAAAGSTNNMSLLDMIEMDLQRRQSMSKLAVESGSVNNNCSSFTSGSSSPSSVLQCNSSLLLSDLSKSCRGEETLADVCQQSFNYTQTAAPGPSSYYSPGNGATAMDSPQKSFNSFSSKTDSIVERIPEVLSRNLQRRDQQQSLSHSLNVSPGVQMQRKEILGADMHVLNRTRLRSRALGASLMDGGRPAGTISQDNIKEDFFQGGSNSSSFTQRSNTTSQCGAESTSSEHASSSRQSSPGRDEPTHVTPIGPVKKIEHLNVKVEESSADDQFSPGGSKGPKRRKNQQKRIVCVPVAASGRPSTEGLPSDLWAWRKYGQKPIKGSPFPRGYYRCSSSKGCSARKQVERSRTDPSMLIITYTAEHNHPWPSHRNALAGSSRMNSLEKGGSTVTQELDKTEEAADDHDQDHAAADAGEEAAGGAPINPSAAAVESPVNSPSENFNGAGEESEQASVMSSTAMVIEDQVADSSEPFVFESEKDLDQEMTMVHGHGSLHLTSRSSMNIQDDDFFAELGELPDTNFLFGRPGLVEDRSDDESAHMGMDNVDPYNLFGWSSSGSYLESNAVM